MPDFCQNVCKLQNYFYTFAEHLEMKTSLATGIMDNTRKTP